MTSTVRQRKKTFGRSVEDLDAFPKVPDSYYSEQEASSGIGMSFIIAGFSKERSVSKKKHFVFQ